MKILLTGNRGLIGQALEKYLIDNKFSVNGFDLVDGDDIRNPADIINAGVDCDVLIHLAALLGNNVNDSDKNVFSTNVIGTYNALESARINQFKKVVFLSSVDAFGLFKGEGVPEYFPIDDDHPCRPSTPYAISKKLGEEMCCTFTYSNSIPSICLRPPGVWTQQTYFDIIEARKKRPEYEWEPYWEYGAFIDLRDLIGIIIKCLQSDFNGYHCYLVSSDDITTSGMTSIDLVQKIHPQVRWENQDVFLKNQYQSLLDCNNVKKVFRWNPQYTWQRFIKEDKLS